VDEITWDQIRAESGYPHEITEWTSVTRKIRRVGRFDWNLAGQAIRFNQPTRLAMNGLDYLSYEDKGKRQFSSLTEKTKGFLEDIEKRFGVPIMYQGTGPSITEIIQPGVLRAGSGR
jgi:adenylosuccinate synthase